LLVAFRCLQGLGAAIVAPSALSLLTATFVEERARRRAVGVWTAAAAGGGAAGWLLGGLLTQTLGWRWVFLVNVPVGLVAALLVRRVLGESRSVGDDRGLDLAGAIAVTVGLALLVFGCTQIEQSGVAAPLPWAVLAAAGLVLWTFLHIEARAANPLLPPSLARAPAFVGANAVALVLTATTTPPLFLCVLYLQQVRELSPTVTAAAFAPVNLAVIVGSVVGPRLAGRFGTRRTMAAGLGTVAAGAGMIAAVLGGSGHVIAVLVGAFVVLGAGLGTASVASTAQGITAAGERRGGVASGLLNTSAQVGTVVGLAVLVSVAAARADALAGTLPEPRALVAGYRWGAAGAALLAAITGGALLRRRRGD
jgi:MFS family permease